jgi:hypothetical protein
MDPSPTPPVGPTRFSPGGEPAECDHCRFYRPAVHYTVDAKIDAACLHPSNRADAGTPGVLRVLRRLRGDLPPPDPDARDGGVPTLAPPEVLNQDHDCPNFRHGPDYRTRERMRLTLVVVLLATAVGLAVMYLDPWGSFIEAMGWDPVKRTSIYHTDVVPR